MSVYYIGGEGRDREREREQGKEGEGERGRGGGTTLYMTIIVSLHFSLRRRIKHYPS